MHEMLSDGNYATNESVNELLERQFTRKVPKCSFSVLAGIMECCHTIHNTESDGWLALEPTLMRLKIFLDVWSQGRDDLARDTKAQIEEALRGRS